jgi:phage tail-like protein
MPISQRTDPLRNFKFQIQIVGGPNLNTHAGAGNSIGLDGLGFAEMSGLSVTNELIAYREGGMNTHPHKMVGQSDFPPVSFSRGVFVNQSQMWKWQTFIHSWQQGQGATGSTGLYVAGNNDYRCDIVVRVYDHPFTANNAAGGQYQNTDLPDNLSNTPTKPGNVRLAFRLFNCWPGVFAMNGLNAGDNGILIQQMTVHHEGFYIAFTDTEIAQIGTTR